MWGRKARQCSIGLHSWCQALVLAHLMVLVVLSAFSTGPARGPEIHSKQHSCEAALHAKPVVSSWAWTSWLQFPGATAQFADDLMRAGPLSSSLHGNMYDPADNWTTIRYGWVLNASDPYLLVGNWDAPDKQQQWWLAKRPRPASIVLAVPGRPPAHPTNKTFGTDAHPGWDRAPSQRGDGNMLFRRVPGCDGKVWMPEDIDKGPSYPYGWMRNTALNNLQYWYAVPVGLGVSPDRVEVGTTELEAIVQSGSFLLQDMLPPFGADITWEVPNCRRPLEGDCYGMSPDPPFSWNTFTSFTSSTSNTYGPSAVYDGSGLYPGPSSDASQSQTDVPNLKNDEPDPLAWLRQHVKMAFVDTFGVECKCHDDSWAGALGWLTYSTVDKGNWCPCDEASGLSSDEVWHAGDRCTLSVAPAPADLFSTPGIDSQACADAMPQGVPIITCRSGTDNKLLRLDPAKFDNSSIWRNGNAVFLDTGVIGDGEECAQDVIIAVQFPMVFTPNGAGLLPRVACNRAAYSPRFGGRCAAPVVQYLAYDEAYHTPGNQAKYNIPEYGGCLAGGITRFIGDEIMRDSNDAAAQAQWANYYDWWTPPLWPLDAWYNLPYTQGDSAQASAFVDDQSKLDSLFLYSELFELPATKGPAGCWSFSTTVVISKKRNSVLTQCLQAPTDSSIVSGGWNPTATHPTRLYHTDCDPISARQCFVVDGNLSTGARIMYQGLCVSWLSNYLNVPRPSSYDNLGVFLAPCAEGYVTWKQATPGGYIRLALPECTGPVSAQPAKCQVALMNAGGLSKNMLVIINTQINKALTESGYILNGYANYAVTQTSSAWSSYQVLRNFWLDSFASSAVDMRAHRTRFAPPGARQGPDTIGVSTDGMSHGCNRTKADWQGATLDSCEYNAYVQLGSQKLPPHTCAAEWLQETVLSGANSTLGPVCYPGSSFLYAHGNGCQRMSGDMRLSTRQPGSPGVEKCSSEVGSQYVKVDDLWTAMASYKHDPCGWPFVECVADCSLPSYVPVGTPDAAAKKPTWYVAADGKVKDTAHQSNGADVAVGCTTPGAGCNAAQIMKDPRTANKIAAIDWRNLTLYSPSLDFKAFRGAPGQAVWYLNLNFNMLGGNISNLAELPDIFPNLRHLGLAHCSAGKFAPEYSWQQAQMPYCHDPAPFPNQACFCPDEDWKDLSIIPYVGTALEMAASRATRTAGVVSGVTRMMSGSIPSSWGRNNGVLAAWSNTLISVNIAGHQFITGDLPAEWYDQAAFPKLMYLKLKGTQIRPDFTRLTWTDQATCGVVRWNDYSTTSHSVYDFSKNCDPTAGGSCGKCDWWPLRSAAPFYYSPVNCIGNWTQMPCNQTCQGAIQFEKFIVRIPAANGGQACTVAEGAIRGTTACTQYNGMQCPTDCDGQWGPWGACNNTCGSGVQSSTFSVSVPAAAGGAGCDFADGAVRYAACSNWTDSCNQAAASPVGACGSWGDYSSCNCTDRRRSATYAAFPNATSDEICVALNGTEMELWCDDGDLVDCSGVWVWGQCNATCGGGNQTGWFNITSLPALCGANCSSANGTWGTQACNTHPCPINCTGNWTEWGSCNTTCGGGNQSRVFNVAANAAYGGNNCSAQNGTVEWQACNTQPCPINCTGSWTGWGACNSTCGGGNASRTFMVTTAAAYGGSNCASANGTVEWQDCNTQPCPLNCTGNWTDWGLCNATCAGGNQSRAFVVTSDPAYGGANCSAANGTMEWQACNTQPCPVNCVGSWTGWGACNASCGGGNQTRTFVITTASAYGGSNCSAANGTMEWQGCALSPCPINCTGNWTDWDTCNATCGGGNQTSTFVVATAAAHGGTNCSAENGTVEYQACNSQPCSINCTGNWTDWDVCNATCGGGNQTRSFIVAVAAAFGGSNCTAYNGTTEVQACNPQPCPVNCTGNWATWDACNATCGGGNQSRVFVVTSDAAHGGANCSDSNGTVEWQACNTQPCPIDCMGNWTDWGVCNATCGGGNQSRVFNVTVDAAHGGSNCSAQNGTVEWQACNLQPCPINCIGNWTDWDACNATCGGGNRSRLFNMTVDAAHGGSNCSAQNGTVEWQTCNTQFCPINCTGNWTDWGSCNATCGGGNQSRTFVAAAGGAHGGQNCSSVNGTLDWQACNTQPCPIDCMGNWTHWGACNATCGGGNQSRTFNVTTDTAFGGNNCSTLNGTVEWQACSPQPCPIDCMGNWTHWGACNATCGGGNQSRTFNVTTDTAFGGNNCSTLNGTVEWQACSPQPCPIDCVGNWTAWDVCNATCAGGNQSRIFVVTAGADHGGNNCSIANETQEWQACNIQPCPVNCVGSWSAWDVCNATCGGGKQSRTFSVTTAAAFSGTACSAANGSVEWQACNTQPCPVNCAGSWGSWSACNASCGGGTQTRTFTVTTAAAHGGTTCSAVAGQTESQACNTGSCPSASSPPPQQGVCEVSDITPVIFMPRGTASADLPALVIFSSPQSKALYCPRNAVSLIEACYVKLQVLPVYAADPDAAPVALPAPVLVPVDCEVLTALSCQLMLPLGPQDGRFEVQLQPANYTATVCNQQVTLQLVTAEVILDSTPPSVSKMELTVAPTANSPSFQVRVTFSEPVLWLANATDTSSTNAVSTSNGSVGTSVNTFTSSRLLLTNAALLNMSAVPGATAVLASGESTAATTGFYLWFKSWSGAEAAVNVMGAAYQDLSGNKGLKDTVFQVNIPGTDLIQRAASIVSTATAVSATASALSVAAAAASSTAAGGTTSLVRSIGHTQFLAMSVSLAVPWLPAEYISLCAGLEWSNLVKPVTDALKLNSNTTAYNSQSQSKRHLLSSGLQHSTCGTADDEQCNKQSSAAAITTASSDSWQDQLHHLRQQQQRNQQHLSFLTGTDLTAHLFERQHMHRQLRQQRQLTGGSSSGSAADITAWLNQNGQAYGSYVGSDGSGSSGSTETLSFASDGSAGNISALVPGSTNTLIVSGTSRWPAAYSLRELQMSILVLFVAVGAASLLEGLVLGVWRLLRLNPDSLPNLLYFPKPQLLVYSLLMVPVIYGASKLAVGPTSSSADKTAAICCLVLVPAPVLAFWVFVFTRWWAAMAAAAKGDIKRTRSSILRAYRKSTRNLDGGAAGSAQPAGPVGSMTARSQSRGQMNSFQQQQQQRGQATLALMADVQDNPTLIIRDRHTDEEVFEPHAFDPEGLSTDSDSSEGASRQHQLQPRPMAGSSAGGGGGSIPSSPSSTIRPWRSSAGTTGAAPAADSNAVRRPYPSDPGLRGRSGQLSAGTAGAGASSLKNRTSAVTFLPTDDLGEERIQRSRSQSMGRSPRGVGEPSGPAVERSPAAAVRRMQSLQSLPGSALGDNSDEDEPGGQPLGEGIDGGSPRMVEAQAVALAEAWQAGRAAGQAGSSWGGQSPAKPGTTGAGPVAGGSASGYFQLSFSQDGAQGGVQPGGQSLSRQPTSGPGGPLKRQGTWMTSASNSLAAADLLDEQHEAAATIFLDKWGYLVDDLVGDDRDVALGRVQLHILLLPIVSVLQRCLTALFFGLFHFNYISLIQLLILVALHAGFVGYLIGARPYASLLLLLSDLLAYLCEVVVLIVALLLQDKPNQAPNVAQVFIVCYFIDVAAMIVPEVLRYCVIAWTWWQRRQQQQQQQGQQPVHPNGDAAGPVARVPSIRPHKRKVKGKGASAATGGADGYVMVGQRVSDAQGAAAANAAASAALQLTSPGSY